MKFSEIENHKIVLTSENGIVKYKKYNDKFYWLQNHTWIEIQPNYEYDKYVYNGEIGNY